MINSLRLEPKTFEDLDVVFCDATIFLDVDGTLLPDGESSLSPEVTEKVRQISKENQVLLCTNKRDRLRWQVLEQALGLPVVTKRHKKPSKSILNEVEDVGERRIVIGDKFLTDFLFARRIGATFVKTKRKLSGMESLGVKMANLLDDVVWKLTQRFFS